LTVSASKVAGSRAPRAPLLAGIGFFALCGACVVGVITWTVPSPSPLNSADAVADHRQARIIIPSPRGEKCRVFDNDSGRVVDVNARCRTDDTDGRSVFRGANDRLERISKSFFRR
jgi:hypothetical protein